MQTDINLSQPGTIRRQRRIYDYEKKQKDVKEYMAK